MFASAWLAKLAVNLAIPAWVRPFIAPVLIAAGIGIGVLWFQGHYYDKGYAAKEAEVAAVDAVYQRRIAELNGRIKANAERDAPKIAETIRARPGRVKATQEAVRANPDFAAIRVPDSVHAERVRQLDAVKAAASDR